jgi:AcrR family transcriptional regulator
MQTRSVQSLVGRSVPTCCAASRSRIASMSPRPYRLGQRRAAVEQTRARVLRATRDLLADPAGLAGFSIDAVARQAGVARMTVYYQFDSKLGLLEAVYDDLAVRGQIGERLAHAFQRPDPQDALGAFIAAFGHFWSADRLVTRRLRSLAALDPDIEQGLRARDERLREGLRVIVRRLAESRPQPPFDSFEETVDILSVLTSFESFDKLAGSARSPEEVAPLIYRLACASLGLHDGGPARSI